MKKNSMGMGEGVFKFDGMGRVRERETNCISHMLLFWSGIGDTSLLKTLWLTNIITTTTTTTVSISCSYTMMPAVSVPQYNVFNAV